MSANGDEAKTIEVKSEEREVKVNHEEQTCEDAEKDDENLDNDTEIVTMVDVLEEEAELEDNADAVLGGSDDSKCTHCDVKAFRRQALYACKTCADETGIWQAGICLACSYVCHDKHELYELYTKRAFKCDCGIESKFPGKKCSLIPDKDVSENAENSYSQNFQGKYCTCQRPYPDPDNSDEDEMIQCIACEDWFHSKHLVGDVPDNDDFSEMVCHNCMSNLSFLWYYYPKNTSSKRMKVENDSKEPVEAANEANGSNGDAVKNDVCLLKSQKEKEGSAGFVNTGATFWDENWRKILCSCESCLALYKQLNCSYLIDLKDTTHHYESESRQKDTRCSSSSSMERGMEAFNHMPRPQQIEMLHGYNDLQTALKDYLKKFADEKIVVTSDHITKFFEDFNKSRSSKTSAHLMSSCR